MGKKIQPLKHKNDFHSGRLISRQNGQNKSANYKSLASFPQFVNPIPSPYYKTSLIWINIFHRKITIIIVNWPTILTKEKPNSSNILIKFSIYWIRLAKTRIMKYGLRSWSIRVNFVSRIWEFCKTLALKITTLKSMMNNSSETV